jgi:hypothetical protein
MGVLFCGGLRRTIPLLLCMLLSCTACTVSYQPHSLTGGYREQLIRPGEYHVRYDGNGSIPLVQAADFALLRAAVIAEQQQHNTLHISVLQVKVDEIPSGTMGVTIRLPRVYLHMMIPPAVHDEAKDAVPNVACRKELAELMILAANRTPRVQVNAKECITRIKQQYDLTDAQLSLSAM